MSDPTRCRHRTMQDHSRTTHAHAAPGHRTIILAGPPIRVWTCTDCGNESPWTDKHAYYGALECRDCMTTVIDHVSCGCKPQKRRPL